MGAGRPSKYDSKYIKDALEYAEKDDLPSVEGFALKLKVVKSTLYEWAKKDSKFSNALDFIKLNYQQKLIGRALINEYNPTFAKFLLSAQLGLVEKQSLDHTTNGKDLNLNVNFIDSE